MTKNKTNYKVVITAIASLTILECVALCNGINGTIFSLVIAIVAGLAGLTIPTPKILTD